MADTPFQLYEEAYQLHYRTKNIADAVRLYEAIMREFPDSSECGYAFIQLQKIKANEVTSRLRSHTGNTLALAGCFAGCAALLIAAGGILTAFRELRQERNRSTFAVAALAKLQAGKVEEASKVVEEMRVLYKNDLLVRELTLAIENDRAGSANQRSAGSAVQEGDSSSKVSSQTGTRVGEIPVRKSAWSRARAALRAKAMKADTHATSLDAVPANVPSDSSGHL